MQEWKNGVDKETIAVTSNRSENFHSLIPENSKYYRLCYKKNA